MKITIQPAPSLGGVELVREDTRRKLAFLAIGGFFFLVALIVGGTFAFIRFSPADGAFDLKAAQEFLLAFGSVFSGIIGAVIGFYFGSDDKA
jgi:hypothetical protein